MKKSNKKSGSKISKNEKEKIEKAYESKDYIKVAKLSSNIVNKCPNNVYGYIYLIKGLTNDYNKYLENDDLKEVKDIFDKVYNLSSKSKKEELKEEFNDYLCDIKEVDNLKKIKTELISNELLKYLYQDKLKLINQNINTLNTYNEKGIRIKNGYDFLNAIFLLICLIINLIFRNCLLIFTIPFGIYSLITIYSFFETNFFNKGRLVSLKNNNYNLAKMIESKSNLLKKEISKTTDMINFIKEQKLSTLTKLPSTFNESINDLIIDNEQDKAKVIFESLESNNIALFNSLLSENTNFTLSIINEKLNPFTFEDDLEDYVNKKEEEKKSNQSEIIVMQKIKKMDIFLLALTLFISAFSIVFIKENIKSYDLICLIIGTFIGILSILIYNINTGKHKKVFDTFLDNLLFCVFNSSLIYDILYLKDYQFRFIYIFIMIPLTFMFMYLGISMLISIIKYKHLLKRLSK